MKPEDLYVRHLELGALRIWHAPALELETLRVANDMRVSSDSVEETDRGRLWDAYRSVFDSRDPASTATGRRPMQARSRTAAVCTSLC